MALLPGVYNDIETTSAGEILNRVAQHVIDLDLKSVLDRVYVLERLSDFTQIQDAAYPLCVVASTPENATDGEGPVNTSTVHYPILVAIIWGSDRGQRETWATRLEQRQEVARAFRKTRPIWKAMVNCTLKKSTVRAGEPFIDDAIRKSLDAQWWLVDVKVTEQL